MSNIPKIGETAPDFNWQSGGEDRKLSDFVDKYVVLYFYPKDNTPGCTIEAREFAIKQHLFEALNAVIIGVSRDSEECHRGFADRSGVNFALVADTEGVGCESYGVLQEKKGMFGKVHRGIVRSTFLINPEGNIAAVWEKVSVSGHVDAVLDSLEKLQKKH